jgi:hypothetical protein
MTVSQKIEIWTTAPDADIKAALPTFSKTRIEVTHVAASALSKNLTNFLTDMQAVFEMSPSVTPGFHIDEIELNLGVNSQGGVALIGKLEAGVQVGIKVKLKRAKASE